MKTISKLTLLYFIFIILISGDAKSQNLYGITSVLSPPSFSLSLINPPNGSLSVVSSSPNSNSINSGLSALDPINKRFFHMSQFTNGPDTLYCIDLVTGSVISKNKITVPGSYFNQLLEFNCINMTLYGIVEKTTDHNIYLVSINPLTGVETMISTSPITKMAGSGQSSLDPFTGLFFFPSVADTLCSVSLTTGQVVNKIKMSLGGSYCYPVFEFNNLDQKLYTLIQESSSSYYRLASVNPVTGSVTIISQNRVAKGATFASSIDPINHLFYNICWGDTLLSIDLLTGNAVSKNKLSLSGTFTPIIEFTKSCATTVGILNNKQFENSFQLFPNPSTGQITIKQTDKNQFADKIDIYDNNGKLVFSQKVSSMNEIIETNLSKGIYLYSLKQLNGKTVKSKLIIE